ncbi:hypothetical protein BU23DRAFT_213579 [Bimuria novae-zelandiae CBS 107.79]|uniref:EthD domain-containing protein n=1 Tax=Bimuria novae-zelandiae CBS 107.79 TaxID=1447943 RepID=A0A6A5V2K4_9PLEO|nr:hypothetical protein BU23DRAFT_213579 [Bimuria novae-zelandiae CBS 107.79]
MSTETSPTVQPSTPYTILAFLRRAPHLTPTAFRTYYETQHIPLVHRLLAAANVPPPLSYTRRYLETSIAGDPVGFDCVTELVFENEGVGCEGLWK